MSKVFETFANTCSNVNYGEDVIDYEIVKNDNIDYLKVLLLMISHLLNCVYVFKQYDKSNNKITANNTPQRYVSRGKTNRLDLKQV